MNESTEKFGERLVIVKMKGLEPLIGFVHSNVATEGWIEIRNAHWVNTGYQEDDEGQLMYVHDLIPAYSYAENVLLKDAEVQILMVPDEEIKEYYLEILKANEDDDDDETVIEARKETETLH